MDGEVLWEPTAEYRARSRVGRFMARHGLGSLADLQRRSVEDPEWYWDAVSRDLGLVWARPYARVLDESAGPAWPRWFPEGALNLSVSCLDRHLAAGRGRLPALIWEGDGGETRTLTYAALAETVGRLAGALARCGVGPETPVGLYLPLCPEAAAALLAVIRLGAIAVPCFSGFGAQAVAARLADAGARVLITADGFHRRGRPVRLKETAEEALAACPSVETVLVVRRLGEAVPWTAGRDRWWHDVVPEAEPVGPVVGEADRPCLLAYTSGTTGRPKGAVLTQGGFGIKAAHDWAYVMDVGPEDRVLWVTDLGWLMGPLLVVGTLVHGATAVLFEGTPDHPAPDRLWAVAARHQVSVLGFAPTAARALMPHGAGWVRRHDLRRLRLLGSTGEPWNPEPFRWVFETVGGGRLPLINYAGGTEVSGGIVAGSPVAPIKPCAFAGPVPGMAADVYDEDGRPVRGRVGELVVTRPWPGMTRGFWRDPRRYEETYWARWPGVWVHGDWACVDPDGFWFLLGRSDDTLKVAGKRVGPAEVEAVLGDHPAVSEAAVIGVPHPVKGEAVVAFVILRPGVAPGEPLRAELAERVAQTLGRPLRPERVLFVRDLPRTRSAKLMRRVVRAVYLGRDPGDLSALDNPEALQAVAEAR